MESVITNVAKKTLKMMQRVVYNLLSWSISVERTMEAKPLCENFSTSGVWDLMRRTKAMTSVDAISTGAAKKR